ncbi:GTPase [Massilia atriviolacea]|uniref:GTPase n=1 Tax=Massilia atriviolacea TaxID=2495579 RepID=A0A430HLT9_9BURK|nr:GTPase [Massilia atriviolacea]RSZ58439.1 GTPase [Massilia atriviolacea]
MSAPAARRAALTLVTGGSAAQREAAIAARLAALSPAGKPGPGPEAAAGAQEAVAVLLEGLPSGQTLLSPSDRLQIHRIAPGCLCCTGHLVLRVTLNRILRLRPDRLFIGLAATDHLDQLRSWLQHPPYDQLLEPTADLRT